MTVLRLLWIGLVSLIAYPAWAHPAEDELATPPATPLPSLKVLLNLVRERAPDIVLGRAAVRSSRASYVGARRGPVENPYLEVTGERTGAGTNGLAVNGTLWLPVEVAGQRGRRIAEADAFVRVHEAGLEQLRASALAEGVRAYGQAVVAAARVRLLQEIVASSQGEADLYNARVASGDATRLDAKLAEVELEKNRALLEEFRADLDVALIRIQRLVAKSYGAVHESPDPPDYRVLVSGSKAASLPVVARLRAEAQYHARVKERAAREGVNPVSLMLIGGRGELGDARLGAGLAYTFPVFWRNQGEQARAEGERQRALTELSVRQRVLATHIGGLVREIGRVRNATRALVETAIPAAEQAVDAAVATHRIGKSDLLSVLVTRRDLAFLRVRALELTQREWVALADLVELTGDTP